MDKCTLSTPNFASPQDNQRSDVGRDRLGISEELLPASPHQGFLKQSDSHRSQVLIDRYRLQAGAAKLMPKEAVAKCHFSIIGSAAKLLYIPSSDSAAFGNIETCHSVWMCAVCSPKISFVRQGELNQALTAARALGLEVAFCTYTFAHYKGQNLRGNVDAMLQARRSMLSGRAAKAVKEQYGVVGCIRAIEVTYGDANGWHPHIHELVFLRPGADVNAYGEVLRARWEAMAAKQGLSMNEHGFCIESADTKIADYIAKFGREPGEQTRQAWQGDWNEAAELTQWHRKRGTDQHYTPFDLLRFANEGDEEAAILFRIYARAFKNRRQIFFPGPLRKILGLSPCEQTDQEIAESHELDKQEVAAIERALFYKHIRDKRDARAKILNVVRRHHGELAPVADYLALNFDAVIDTSRPDIPLFRHVDDVPIVDGYKS